MRRFRSLPTNALSAYHFKRFLRLAGARSVEFLQFLTRPVTKETLHQHLCQSQEYFAGIKSRWEGAKLCRRTHYFF